MNRPHIALLLVVATLLPFITACGDSEESQPEPTQFRIRVENVSAPGDLVASDMQMYDITLSPGVWVVHDMSFSWLRAGETLPYPELEALAEEGDPSSLLAALEANGIAAGTAAALDGLTYAEAPMGPGKSATVLVTARPGDRLSMAFMFAESNDVLVATDTGGIELFDAEGVPVASGAVVMRLWDAGTEVNEEPALGPNQVMRQTMAGQGTEEGGTPTIIDGSGPQGFDYPATGAFIEVTIEVVEGQ